jgi:hypothetical protein
LKNTNFDPWNVSFFSCNAVSMYTNIDTNHTLEVLEPFLSNLPLCTGCLANATITALDILMRQNVFKLGDTYWKQNSGTALGTGHSAGVNYAELYYGTLKIELTANHPENLIALYCRYIDDGIGLWIHHPDRDIDRDSFASLQATMNSFGLLKWEFSELCKSIDFMDVHLYITPTGWYQVKTLRKPYEPLPLSPGTLGTSARRSYRPDHHRHDKTNLRALATELDQNVVGVWYINFYQSVTPDGPSMPPPIKKETWVAGKQEGGAGRQSVVPAARLSTVRGTFQSLWRAWFFACFRTLHREKARWTHNLFLN